MDPLIKSFLESKVPAYVVVVSLLLGIWALVQTPREEEPQIVVPMIDVVVTTKTSSAREAERLVTTPLEKLLSQVPGVKHVYSMTNHNQVVVTLRFEVGQVRETALLNTYNKLNANIDSMPSAVEHWQVKPQEVDDVPIVVLGLWSKDQAVIDDFELRRFAQELSVSLQSIDNTSEVKVIGGRPRQVEVALSPEKMASLQLSVQDVIYALQVSNQRMTSRSIRLAHQQITIESGDVFSDIAALELLPVKVINQAVVKLKDIAVITDGPAPPMSYTDLSFTPSHTAFYQHMDAVPFVAISVAKQPKTNAVEVAQQIHQLVAEMETNVFPEQLQVETLRDYGETANDKVNNLTSSLLFAIITVVVFIWLFLGWRAAVVVGLAIPICYGLTLFIGYAFGYTINRVTLFALILSLGLLVDDPIAGADNITRFISKHPNRRFTDNIVGAISEIERPLILSTVTIVLAFLPLAFITGMMGPYMAPMAFNVPLSIIVSTLIAFLVTPWLAKKWLKQSTGSSVANDQMATNNTTSQLASIYRRFMFSIMKDKQKTQLTLIVGL